ncbi:hypothetical protein ACEOWG_002819 [Bacillus cereus]
MEVNFVCRSRDVYAEKQEELAIRRNGQYQFLPRAVLKRREETSGGQFLFDEAVSRQFRFLIRSHKDFPPYFKTLFPFDAYEIKLVIIIVIARIV